LGTTHLRSDLEVGNTASKVTVDKTKGVRLVNIDAWEDLRFPVAAVQQNPATSKPDNITFLGGTRALGFDNSASEWVTFSAQMPHAWKEGSDVEFHVHWTPTDDSAGSVRWVLEYTWANEGAVFPATATIGGTGVAASANRHTYTDTDELDGTGKTISSMIMCRLIRNVSHTDDDYAADAAMIEADFHYKVDSFGSDEEHNKS